MARIPTFEYIVGADLEDIELWVSANGELPDFSTDHTFTLHVAASDGTAAFTKSAGITGAAGSGTDNDPTGVPNVVIQWATAGELNDLSGGLYVAELVILRTSDSRERKRRFYLQMTDTLA